MKLRAILISCVFLAASCQTLVVDPSPAAADKGDKTLIVSAGGSAPKLRQGFDMLRVVEGSLIQEIITLPVPLGGPLLAVELRIRYKGEIIPWTVDKLPVEIPWKELIKHDTWQLDDESPVQISGTVRYQGGTNEEFFRVLGFVFPVVLKKGYSPMPIDSGNHTWETECKIQYSTAGRSAIQCSN